MFFSGYLLPIETKMELFARTYAKDTGINIIFGNKFSTNGKNITILPVTDRDDPWIRFMTEVLVYHETGHIKTKDFPAFHAYTDKTKKDIFNWVRDVVVEHYMETEYPGLPVKWIEFLTAFMKKIGNAQFKTSNPYNQMMKMYYIRCREKQLGADLGLVVPKTVQEVFDIKMARFIDRGSSITTISESQAIVEEIFTVLKDDLKDQKEEQDKQKQQQQKKKPSKAATEADDGAGEPGDKEESGQPGDEGPDSSSGNDTDEQNDPETDHSDDDQEGSGSEAGDESDESDAADDPSAAGTDDAGDGSGDESDGGSGGEAGDESDDGGPGGEDDGESGNEAGDESSGGADTGAPSDEATDLDKNLHRQIEDGDTGKNMTQAATEEINQYAATTHLYRVTPGLKETIIIEPPPSNKNWETEVRGYEKTGREMIGPLRMRIKRLLISEKAPIVIPNMDSGSLNIRQAYKIPQGRRDVFKTAHKGSYEDSVVYIVVDNSDSMNDYEKKLYTQSLLAVISSDLDSLRIPFGAVGFTSDSESSSGDSVRTKPCRLRIIKGLDEPYRRVRHRFTWPSYHNLTVELPAIEYATKQLAMRRETKKIMFILTDGKTCSQNSLLDSALRRATKEYIARIIRAGIRVVGLGLKDESIKEYCPDFIHVSDPKTFAPLFYQKITKLLL